MEISYRELRQKDVVNLVSGVKYGKICDMVIESTGKNVLGLVVPTTRRLFFRNDELFIPWGSISKIGKDVILVQMNGSGKCAGKAVSTDITDEDFI